MSESLFQKYGIVVDSGKEIFRENEAGNVMYIIQDGNVRISKLIDGKHHTLAVLGKGDFFGEMAIVTRVKRTATATAVGTVRMLSFDRNGFLSMIANDARIALNIIDKLCRRLQAANAQIQVLANRNEKGRILLDLYYAFAEQAKLDLHKTTREISINLDVDQERILALLKKLGQAGIVSIGENVLVLRDRERLASLAQSAGTIKTRA
jgi:CRP/FNR family transcriptional regulator, cyclic AMP receptor protein